MNRIEINDDIQETYITAKYKGKERKMRRFGAVTFTNRFGVVKELSPAEYLYIYKDGKNKLSFSKSPTRTTKKGNK